MDPKLLSKLQKQTVKIYMLTESETSLGTGFCVNDKLIITAEHCLYRKDADLPVQKVIIRRWNEETIGDVKERKDGVAFIRLSVPLCQEDGLPLGYCENLNYGIPVDIYGYPRQENDGFPFSTTISENIQTDTSRIYPTIKCLVKNEKGGLNRYDGLSGGPVVVQNHIVGMVCQEDEAGNETIAIRILDFTLIREVIEQQGIMIKRVHIQENGQANNRYKANRMSLYRQAWWIMKKNGNQDEKIYISDRYTIVLATLLLGIEGSADIVLASSWQCGLSESLQEETAHYKREISDWPGRYWVEYENGQCPEWSELENHSGVILSIHAEDCDDILISELLMGRRTVQKEILVLWNIWSECSEQAVLQAAKMQRWFRPSEQKDVLTVHTLWKEEGQSDIIPSDIFLVHETANAWLESLAWRRIDLESFLLELNAEETDVLAWEVFRRYQVEKEEELRSLFTRLWDLCSDSIKILSAVRENDIELSDLLKVEPFAIKSWFSTITQEVCYRILSYLGRQRDQTLYWCAAISNLYCTKYILKECCRTERNELVQLILGQNTGYCDDIMLFEEAKNIRRQIKPD